MSSFIIQGGKRLGGKLKIAGNKNAALPIIAATVLTDSPCTLENVPSIIDVQAMLDIAAALGKKIERLSENAYRISGKIVNNAPAAEQVQKLRASILFMGALTARTGEAFIAPPGGCVIGRRNLAPHIDAFADTGIRVDAEEHVFHARRVQSGNTATFLQEASVTATENIMLSAALNPGVTHIENAACEPHVADLARVLEKMGAHIEGIGSNRLKIHGQNTLSGFRHRIVADNIECGTFAILAAATQSELTLENINAPHMSSTQFVLNKMGVRSEYSSDGHSMKIFSSNLHSNGIKIKVGLWPGFPTDLMSPMIVLATQAEGSALCHDWMFESRMFFVDKLIAMGADITLCDPHRVMINGPTRLKGQNLSSPDIRAGIALVIAALCANGQSRIANAGLVDRGYEKIVKRLQSVGADIVREG